MSSSPVFAATLLSGVSAAFLLLAVVSPWMMYTDFSTYNGVYTSFGIGPFVAGASTGAFSYAPLQYFSGSVWWANLNSENVCVPGSTVYSNWALPNSFCSADMELEVPSLLQALQAFSVLALVFSASAMGLGYYFLKTRHYLSGVAASVGAALGMFCAMCTFSIWVALPMAQLLRSEEGGFIPLYSINPSEVGGNTAAAMAHITLSSTPQKVKMYNGWTFVTTVFSFVFLLLSTCIFAAQAKRAREEEAGEFGLGIGV